ncbi:hypothetical protein GCK32_014481, partial [Trichostrongylus colubriformis]
MQSSQREEIKPEAPDLYIFLNDYMCGYWANSEWKIKEKPMESTSDARSPSPFISVAQLSANVESDNPSDVEVVQDSCEEELFTCSKREDNDTSSYMLPNQQEEDTNATDHLQRSPSQYTEPNASSSSSRDFIDEEHSKEVNKDSKFEEEMFKEISVTDLLQPASPTEEVPASNTGGLFMFRSEDPHMLDKPSDLDEEFEEGESLNEAEYNSYGDMRQEEPRATLLEKQH